jgi:protein dithiol oxidoreductase (disulfide-forming)
MKRRDFSLSALGMAAIPWMANAQNSTKAPQEGTEYLSLEQRIPSEAGSGKIEVLEFFWYSCPHCNAFEPAFEAWVKKLPQDVVIKRTPVRFREDFEPQQRAYYVLEALNKVNDLHAKLFRAIHVDHQRLDTVDALAQWAQSYGIAADKFKATYNSFSVTTKSNRATQLQEAFKVQGVPAFGVAGRFYTDGGLAGNMTKVLNTVDYLVNEVRKGR